MVKNFVRKNKIQQYKFSCSSYAAIVAVNSCRYHGCPVNNHSFNGPACRKRYGPIQRGDQDGTIAILYCSTQNGTKGSSEYNCYAVVDDQKWPLDCGTRYRWNALLLSPGFKVRVMLQYILDFSYFQGNLLGTTRRRRTDSTTFHVLCQLIRYGRKSAANSAGSCGRWTSKASHWIQATSFQYCSQMHWILPQTFFPIKQWLCQFLAKSTIFILLLLTLFNFRSPTKCWTTRITTGSWY